MKFIPDSALASFTTTADLLAKARTDGHPMPTAASLEGMGEILKETFGDQIADEGEGRQLFTLLSLRNAERAFLESIGETAA